MDNNKIALDIETVAEEEQNVEIVDRDAHLVPQIGRFEERPKAEMLVKWVLFTAAITGMAILSAFYPIWANVPLIVIPSLLTLFLAKPVFFEKLKLATLITLRVLVVFAVIFNFGGVYSKYIVMVAMMVNILEATFTDLKNKQYFNFVSGLFLAVGVLFMKGSWGGVAGGPGEGYDYYFTNGFNEAATITWVVAYTIWNWIFVTGEFSASVSLMHVGFLASPIIACLATMGGGFPGGFGLWYLVRANSLSIGGYMQITCKNWFEREFYNKKFERFVRWTHKPLVQALLMCVCLGLILYTIVSGAMNGHYAFW